VRRDQRAAASIEKTNFGQRDESKLRFEEQNAFAVLFPIELLHTYFHSFVRNLKVSPEALSGLGSRTWDRRPRRERDSRCS
jgi:hypothetical protein